MAFPAKQVQQPLLPESQGRANTQPSWHSRLSPKLISGHHHSKPQQCRYKCTTSIWKQTAPWKKMQRLLQLPPKCLQSKTSSPKHLAIRKNGTKLAGITTPSALNHPTFNTEAKYHTTSSVIKTGRSVARNSVTIGLQRPEQNPSGIKMLPSQQSPQHGRPPLQPKAKGYKEHHASNTSESLKVPVWKKNENAGPEQLQYR